MTPELFLLLKSIIWTLALFAVIGVIPLIAVLMERKVSAHMQSRPGPMRVGWHGSLQTIADTFKLLLKEDLIPASADKFLFSIAPIIVVLGAYMALAVVPFGKGLIPTDLNIGIFFILSISSITVIGIILAGWSSNNKWALLGAMRSASQIISYEIPVSLTVLTVIIYTGTLSTTEIVAQQAGGILHWNLFKLPFLPIAFILYFIGSLAECNRTPFDLPEAESELVAGFHVEYSGMRWAFFMMGEYVEMFVVSSVATILFLGGWHGFGSGEPWLFGVINFALKAWFLIFVQMWLRWTLPRLRVDQLMYICWKVFIPIAFALVIGVSIQQVI